MIVQEHFNASEATITTITTVGLAALAINQLLGPSATRFSLIRANEDHKDRARLLDFLQEQTILVGLEGDTKEEVVQSLATLLYATSPMELPQQDFVARVMARENEETTCLGRGLMIPHAITESEHELRGVLGISSKGLDLGAPDGRPVHAVLLLVTPESERSHHLQVLAAFATAITRDMNLSEQLYHARSAAHAYNILHAEDAEDMNYFLEDAIERTGRLSR
jgi:mannitol/fructose-specific phosphotransferase system IIA component (Ntr-type)